MSEQPTKNWWQRNWEWFVPVVASCLVLFFVSVIYLVFSLIKSSDVYKTAVAQAQSYAPVQNVIGTPIEKGLFVTGNINISGLSGEANLAIPIYGPDGKATVYAIAAKSAGEWTFSTLIVEIADTKQRFDLLE